MNRSIDRYELNICIIFSSRSGWKDSFWKEIEIDAGARLARNKDVQVEGARDTTSIDEGLVRVFKS